MSSPIMEPPPPTPEQLAAWAAAQEEMERELAAQDAAAAAAAAVGAATTTHSAPVATSRFKRLLAFAGVGLLGITSTAASAFFAWKKPEPPPERPATVANGGTLQDPVQSAVLDDLIRAGSFSDALPLSRRGVAELPEPRRRAMAYREGICLEGLGRLKEAKEAYKRAETTETNQAASGRALLGQARCAIAAGDFAMAQEFLDRVTLRAGHPDCTGTNVAAEGLFLKARLDTLRTGPVRALDPFDSEAVAWPPLDGVLDRLFDWLPPDTAPAASGGVPDGPNVLNVRRGKVGFEVTAHCAERPIAETLRNLASAGGLTLQMDAPTTAALTKEVTALDVEGLPLDELLAALLGRFGFSTKLEGTVLTVGSGTVAPDRNAHARSLRRAIDVAPTHPRAAAMRVWLANLDFGAGRVRDAAKEYLSVLESTPADANSHVWYNLGLAEVRMASLPSARSRFVELIDRSSRTRWVDYGWWWIARTHLDVGDLPSARKALRSAVDGRTREVTSAAMLGICACDLLDGNIESARSEFASHRIVARESHMALGTTFENLLRYRTAPTDSRKSLFLTALDASADGRALGPVGPYLVGRMYRELGMPERTAALYDAASDGIRGPLAVRMTFEAAEWYALINRNEDARQRFLAVSAVDAKGYGPQAEFHLASMALRGGNTADCLSRCRRLLTRPGADSNEVLTLMGRAYEVQRNYRAAAECFAGRVPPEAP